MPINYKDINQLTEKTSIAGTEKVPVSGTKFVLFNKIKDWIINSLKTAGLDLGGNQIKNVAIEVVTSLPAATYNFVGRRVTYQGRDYIWNGSAWKCDSDYLEIGGRNLLLQSQAKPQRTNGASQNWVVPPYYLSEPLIVGQKYTFYCDSLIGATLSKLSFREPNYNIPMSGNKVTFIATAPRTYLYIYFNETGATYNIGGVKLVKGDKCNDWTPAPEDKADENQTINFDTNNVEPTQSGTTTKTSTWLWQYLTQSINFLWLKLKELFPLAQATTNNYIPKINNIDKKLVKSNISDDGTTPKYGDNTIWHSGNDGSGSSLDADLLDGIDSTGFQKIKTAYLSKTLIAPTSNDFWVRIGSITSFSAFSIINLVIQSTNGSDAPRVLDINIVLNYWANAVKLIQNIATSYNGNHSGWGQTELIITEDQKVWLRFVGSSQSFVHKMIAKSTDDTFQFSTEFTEVLYSAPTNILRTLTFMEGALNTSDLDIKVKRVIKAGSDDSYMLLGGGGEKPITDFATSTHDHDSDYLGITDTAVDSNKLDGKEASEFAQLESGKVKATNLPDYLLGQVLYGGSINRYQTCTLSLLYKDKFNITANTRPLANLTALSHVGVYFIASGNFLLNGTIDVSVGDWVISDGNAWGKIDNTDAVASVNGLTGVINLTYGDLGAMPPATETKVGGIKLGYNPKLDADLLDGKHASDFATSTHNHATTYLGIIEKATDSDKLDGKHASEFITSADFTTNEVSTPSLSVVWSIKNNSNAPVTLAGMAGQSITLEFGYKPTATQVQGSWSTSPLQGVDLPTSIGGLWVSSSPTTPTTTIASIVLTNALVTTSSVSSTPLTLYAKKKGITVSGTKLILPTGDVSKSTRLTVNYQIPIYYGQVASQTPTASAILDLFNAANGMKSCNNNSRKQVINANASSVNYWVYAYPDAWGALKSISTLDGDMSSAFIQKTVTITRASGLPILYRLYITVHKGAFNSKDVTFN